MNDWSAASARVCRYKSLCPNTWPNWKGRQSDGVATLVKHLGYKPEEYKLGRSVAQRCTHTQCVSFSV